MGCGWWALALLLVQGYPSSSVLWGHKALRLVIGVLVLIPTWVALVYVRQQSNGAWLVLLLMLIVAVADSGGYFAGRRFGKHKLAPAVSPGKTWEGVLGGFAAALALAAIAHFWFFRPLPLRWALPLAAPPRAAARKALKRKR